MEIHVSTAITEVVILILCELISQIPFTGTNYCLTATHSARFFTRQHVAHYLLAGPADESP